MIEEISALDVNGTLDLVSLLVGKKADGCKLVFSAKVNSYCSLARLKDSLVGKGYAETWC